MYRLQPVFFTTTDVINSNPLYNDDKHPLGLNCLEQTVTRYFRSINLKSNSIWKTFHNTSSDNTVRAMLYIIYKLKPRKTMIITTASKIEFNVRNYLREDLTIDVSSGVDLVLTDYDPDALELSSKLQITTKHLFYFNSSNNLKFDTFTDDNHNPNIVNMNPKVDNQSYLPLTDHEFIINWLNDDIQMPENFNLLCMVKTQFGCGFAAVNLCLNFNCDVYVMYDFAYVYKLNHEHIPFIYQELEEVDEPLTWDYLELLELSNRHCHETGNQFITECNTLDIINLAMESEPQKFVLVTTAKCGVDIPYDHLDYLLISYFNSFKLLNQANSNTKIYYNESK